MEDALDGTCFAGWMIRVADERLLEAANLGRLGLPKCGQSASLSVTATEQVSQVDA